MGGFVTSAVALRAEQPREPGAQIVEDLVAQVRALASGSSLAEASASASFKAAEARAIAISGSHAPPKQDRADAALVFAADELVSMVIERGARGADGADLVVETVASFTGVSSETTAFSIYLRAIASPRILSLPPRLSAEVHLRLLLALAPITDVSLWVEESPCRVVRIASAGEAANTRRFRHAAIALLAGQREPDSSDGRAQIQAVPVMRWDRPVGAVVGRSSPHERARAAAFLRECRTMLAPILERDMFLDRSTSREQQLQQANERRLLRVGFDLHDGPLQDIAALASDMRLARDQLATSLSGRLRSIILGRFQDLDGRLVAIDQTLRELSQSLESSSIVERPLDDTLRRELAGFLRRSDVRGSLLIEGTFDTLSASQRIAILRIVQESLANVREHAAATSVTVALEQLSDGVRLRVADDGAGFDVSQTVVAAARRGRLGLVGMSERVRLLGGSFSLTSTPSGGTEICVTLPSWEPVRGASRGSKEATV
jgi:signal transduction histidine kinase